MKKFTLLSFLLIFLQGNSILPDDEAVKQKYLEIRREQYEKKTTRCTNYAHRFESEYSYKSLYDYCCVSFTADLEHRPPEYKKEEVTRAINAVLGVEKECGKAWNECLRIKLNQSNLQYMCNNLSAGERLEWSDEDLSATQSN